MYEKWSNTLQSADIGPISDDTCCKLMAITYVFGGANEAFTHNTKLVSDIKYAQKRMNLFGGEIPNADLLPKYQAYTKELQPNGWFGDEVKCDWAVELMSRYNIKL